MTKRPSLIAVLAACALATACGPRGPLRSFTAGEEIAFYDFSSSDQFEQGVYETASLLVRDGVYRIDVREGDNELWWGQWGAVLDDAIIDVDANLLSQTTENAFGIMCRVRGSVGLPVDTRGLDFAADAGALLTPEAAATEALSAMTEAADAATEAATSEATEDTTEAATTEPTEEAAATEAAPTEQPAQPEATSTSAPPAATIEPGNGDGYYFLIQGSGSAGIFRARGRALTPLADWRTSDAIKISPDVNHLRAVCSGDYLAFFVNDVLVADATDTTYSQGQVGLAASTANRLGLRVEFDNLAVSGVVAS